MATGRRATGRPTKAAAPGKRVSLGLKVSPRIKTLLDKAAKENVRTQSQEAEARLLLTFQEQFLPQLLEATYGANVAGILLAVGWAMRHAGLQAFILADRVAPSMLPWAWEKNPYAYDQAVKAASVVLNRARPKGDTKAPRPSIKDIGERIGNMLFDAITSERPDPPLDIVQGLLKKERGQ